MPLALLFWGQMSKLLLLPGIELDDHGSWSLLTLTDGTYGVFGDLRSKVILGSFRPEGHFWGGMIGIATHDYSV